MTPIQSSVSAPPDGLVLDVSVDLLLQLFGNYNEIKNNKNLLHVCIFILISKFSLPKDLLEVSQRSLFLFVCCLFVFVSLFFVCLFFVLFCFSFTYKLGIQEPLFFLGYSTDFGTVVPRRWLVLGGRSPGKNMGSLPGGTPIYG